MKQVILIGTVHLGLTPIAELVDEVQSHKPDRILIEVDQDGNGAEEMKLLVQWCIDNNVEYRCIDQSVPTEKYPDQPTEKQIADFTVAISEKLQLSIIHI